MELLGFTTHTITTVWLSDQFFGNTKEDLVKIKKLLSNTDVIEACTRERANTKWKFYKLTNVTVFVALLKEVAMGCKHAVLPEPLTKNYTVICRSYEEITRKLYIANLWLFTALALLLHGNGDFRKKFRNCSHSSYRKMEELIQQARKLFVWTMFQLWKTWFKWTSSVRHRLFCWSNGWRACQKKCWQRFQHCSTIKLQQSHLLRPWYQYTLQSLSLLIVLYFLQQSTQLGRHLTTCIGKVKHVYPKNLCQIREILFYKLDSFVIA